MSLADLQPINTKKAKAGAVNVFMRFLREEDVALDAVDIAVRGDPTGATLVALMDRFGIHLAFFMGKGGNPLTRHTVMQYFRQVKGWLLERFPASGAHVEKALLKKGRVLEGFCVTRPSGRVLKQAVACTKEDLGRLTAFLYSSATTPTDYQDAALLVLLWYLLGRASDLTLTQKQFLSICSNETFFIRFVRVKMSEEQGLSLFPDASPHTCPITTLTSALAMQTTPSASLLPHLPMPTRADVDSLGPLVPLVSVLGQPVDSELLERAANDDASQQQPATTASRGIHAYVNLVLARIASPAGVRATLSSHSFRRWGAQHANGRSSLALQWIVDHGGWNMGTTHKAFMYIFNTTAEDRKVAKVLSGHEPDARLTLVGLDAADATTRAKMERVRDELFASCMKLGDPRLRVSDAVADVLFAHLAAAYPQLKALCAESPLVARVERALERCCVEEDELLAWSTALHAARDAADGVVEQAPHPKHLEMLQRQAATIDELIALNKKLTKRVRQVEAALESTAEGAEQATVSVPKATAREEKPQAKRRKSASTNLVEAWFELYTLDPRSLAAKNRQRRSSLRSIVGFMRVFADAYTLDHSAADFRDAVLRVGAIASANIQALFEASGVKGASHGTALKALRALYRTGALDARIRAFRRLCDSGLVVDPLFPSGSPSLLPFAELPKQTTATQQELLAS